METKKIILLSLFSLVALFSSASFADAEWESKALSSGEYGGIDSDSGRKLGFSDLSSSEQLLLSHSTLSDAQIAKLDQILSSSGPAAVLSAIDKLPNDPKLMRWLDARGHEGHVLFMWDLAGRLSQSKPYDSMVWLFSGLISLWQETSICVDPAVKRAGSTLSAKYAAAQRVSRINPGKVKPAMRDALKLISSVKQFPDPTDWLCVAYSSHPVKNDRRIAYVYAERNWSLLRERELSHVIARLGIELPPSETPPDRSAIR